MFQRDVDAFNLAAHHHHHHHPMNSFSASSSYCESSNANNKRNSADMNSGRMKSNTGEPSACDAHFQTFCSGVSLFAWSLLIQFNQSYLTLHYIYLHKWWRQVAAVVVAAAALGDSKRGKRARGGTIPEGASGRGRRRRRTSGNQKVSSGHVDS